MISVSQVILHVVIGEDERIEESANPAHESFCVPVVIDAVAVSGTDEA